RQGRLTAYQAEQVLLGKAHDLVLGPYVLLELLGEGGMGQVFKARHRRLERLAALKLIRDEHLNNAEAVNRFLRESRAAARLPHPNLVSVYDADEIVGRPFLALEFVEGKDLARQVRAEGPLPVGLACEYARQAALGLEHAHAAGLVHRDVKPANLLVRS